METENLVAHPPADDLFEADESPAANEQDLFGIHLDIFLMRVFTASLRRNVAAATLKNLQQSLLNALSGYISGDTYVVCFPTDFVDLVDVNNADFRPFDVVIGVLKQTQDDVFYILTNVAGLGQSRCIGNAKGYVENLGKRTRQERLARSGRSYKEDVALFNLHVHVWIHRQILCAASLKDAFVIVMNRNR